MTAAVMHLVLGDHAADVLRPLLGHLSRSRADLLVFRDVLALGPLDALDPPAASPSRAAYWRHLWPQYCGDFETELAKEEQCYAEVRNACAQGARVVIWHGHHSSAQIWLQRLAATIEGAAGFVDEVDVTADKVVANGRRAHGEFDGIEMPHLWSLCRTMGRDRMHALASEWRANASIASGIRRLVHAEISHHADDFYDPLLIECVADDGRGIDEVIADVLRRCDECLGDVFFRWRLRELVSSGALGTAGQPNRSRLFRSHPAR